MTLSPQRRGQSFGSRTLVTVLVLGLVVPALYLGVQEAKQGVRIGPGESAPEFSLEKYGGGTVSLASQKGKVVMVDFWATWCPPCVEEMPALVKLAKEYEDKGLVFVAANRDDPSEQKAAVGVFVAQHAPELGRHVAFADDPMTVSYRIQSLPTLYLISREGRILDSASGLQSEARLRAMIERAIAAP